MYRVRNYRPQDSHAYSLVTQAMSAPTPTTSYQQRVVCCFAHLHHDIRDILLAHRLRLLFRCSTLLAATAADAALLVVHGDVLVPQLCHLLLSTKKDLLVERLLLWTHHTRFNDFLRAQALANISSSTGRRTPRGNLLRRDVAHNMPLQPTEDKRL